MQFPSSVVVKQIPRRLWKRKPNGHVYVKMLWSLCWETRLQSKPSSWYSHQRLIKLRSIVYSENSRKTSETNWYIKHLFCKITEYIYAIWSLLLKTFTKMSKIIIEFSLLQHLLINFNSGCDYLMCFGNKLQSSLLRKLCSRCYKVFRMYSHYYYASW